MKTNYLLIDYENVQPTMLDVLNQEHFKIIVFVGASQTKIALEVAVALQRIGERAEYIKVSGNGPNALDFHIAFYIGQLAERDPDAFFHIISKDTGFDPLIKHLKDNKIYACRSCDVAEIPCVKIALAQTDSDKVAVIIDKLKKSGAAKPGSVKTLSSSIGNIFQKQLSEAEVGALVKKLQAQGIITIDNAKISYALPA